MDNANALSGCAGEPAMRSAAGPLTFEGTVGLLTEAEGPPRPLAVLFAGAWGLEEMCSRKFFRTLAEQLAVQGIASLRFDYPGTGDALDRPMDSLSIQLWCDTLVAAANLLKVRSGCSRLVIVAQGIGAVIATLAAENMSDLEGLAYLAPVVSGRAYVRELAAFSQMINDKLIVKSEAKGSIEIAGLSLPQGFVEELRRVDLMKQNAPAAKAAIVFRRSDRPSDKAFADHLRGTGSVVADAPFDGHERLVSNPTVAIVPDNVVARLVAWVSGLAPRKSGVRREVAPAFAESHDGMGYTETVLRFGRNKRLFGILCTPSEGAGHPNRTVLLVSSGYDRLSGWGRSTVELARALARANVSSLRFDCANVGDSPPVPGQAGQVLYSDAQLSDMREALDFLERREMTPVVAAGRCSGAYLGFQAALHDRRIVGLVAVNPVVFQWQEGRSVDEALENPTQTLEHYGQRFLEPAMLKRMLRGEIDILGKGMEVAARLASRAVRPVVRAIGGISARERAVFAAFRSLRERNLDIRLLYSASDVGLEELGLFFGKNAKGMRRSPNVHLSIIPEADHNFSPRHARTAFLDAIVSSVEQTGATSRH